MSRYNPKYYQENREKLLEQERERYHCHETGEVRGLLCQPCNTALGMFEDDPKRMEEAISYLRKSSSGVTSMRNSGQSNER